VGKAQLIELVNDQLGLLAALAALGGIAWGFPLADPLAAIAVATLIAGNAVGLFVSNARVLLGRSPDPGFMATLRETALSVPGVLAITNVRAEYVGPQTIHAGMRIAVKPDLTVLEAAAIAEEVERRVHAGPHFGQCFVQVVPADAVLNRKEVKGSSLVVCLREPKGRRNIRPGHDERRFLSRRPRRRRYREKSRSSTVRIS
jgi:cation diffusion facilitator family transporter